MLYKCTKTNDGDCILLKIYLIYLEDRMAEGSSKSQRKRQISICWFTTQMVINQEPGISCESSAWVTRAQVVGASLLPFELEALGRIKQCLKLI